MSTGGIEDLRIACRGLRFPARAQGDGPLVLLLHGFPDCYRSFDAQLPALARAGYRAVAVTLRGYAPEAQPEDGDYSPLALAQDALAWIDALGEPRAHVVGHDWGAALAYTAAALAPERLSSLCAMAVPHSGRFLRDIRRHPRQVRRSWYMGFFQLPWIPERAIRRRDFAFLRGLWRQWSPGWAFTPAEFAPVAETFAQPGVVEAALAYYRSAVSIRALLANAKKPAVADVPVPTLALSGELDGCIGADVFEAMSRPEDFSAGLRLERIGGVGHFLHREDPKRINRVLLDWLKERSAP